MSAPTVAYVSGRAAARTVIREACQDAGFTLVISIFPDTPMPPGFPGMAALVVIESDSSRKPSPLELCKMADAAEVPVLIWASGPSGLDPALVDRRHHVHAPWEPSHRMFRAILRETRSHPERFTRRVTEMAD